MNTRTKKGKQATNIVTVDSANQDSSELSNRAKILKLFYMAVKKSFIKLVYSFHGTFLLLYTKGLMTERKILG